jgi:hypothetical protein
MFRSRQKKAPKAAAQSFQVLPDASSPNQYQQQHETLGGPPYAAIPRPPDHRRAANKKAPAGEHHPGRRVDDDEDALSAGPISPFPPMLPPIPRVASVRSIAGEGRARGARRGDGSLDLGDAIGEETPADDGRGADVGSDGAGEQHHQQRPDRIEGRLPLTNELRQMPFRPASNGASPVASRPHTSSTFPKPSTGQPDPPPYDSKAPPIIFVGPSREVQTSPSKFPSESHRPPPRPPSQSPVTHHSFVGPQSLSKPPHPAQPSAAAPLPPVQKQGKNKLTLLNPVSLFLRRRSGQGLENLSDESLVTRRGAASAGGDVDPSIRGLKVHDFSAPRESYAGRARESNYPGSRGRYPADEPRSEIEHVPVFREHFDEQADEAAIRAEMLSNGDFAARNSAVAPPMPPGPPPPLPLFARPRSAEASPVSPEEPSAPPPPPGEETAASGEGGAESSAPLSPVVEDQSAAADATNIKRASAVLRRQASSRRRPRGAAARTVSRSSRVSTLSEADSAAPLSTLPSHTASRASRFSFQLAGNKDSAAQERMLEERHVEREAAREAARERAERERRAVEGESEGEEYADFDDMGLEEEVPTYGDEWDYGPGLGGMTLDGPGLGNMTLDGPGLGHMTLEDPAPANVASMALRGNPVNVESPAEQTPPVHGLGIGAPEVYIPTGAPREAYGMDDDDLYFDDGLIDEVNYDGSQQFDESVLDDPSHPLYERKQKGASADLGLEGAGGSKDEGDPAANINLATLNPNSTPQALEQYHEILAMAATKAAESGRFNLAGNEPTDVATFPSIGVLPEISPRPDLEHDDSRTSQATTMSPTLPDAHNLTLGIDAQLEKFNPFEPGLDDFADLAGYDTGYTASLSDYDSLLDADPSIVAAANADALAHDDEGEYGSEFGFYASPGGEGDESAHGGWFGARRSASIKRQRSTREPNLTPITERSEYSARNSFASLNVLLPPEQQQGAAGRAPREGSPVGLAQLAMASPVGGWDDVVSMEALLRLRRGAFNASQASIKSWGSGGAAGSSPLAASPIVPNDAVQEQLLQHHLPQQQRARAPSNLSDVLSPGERAEEEARRKRFSEDIRGVVGDEWEDASSGSSFTGGHDDGFDYGEDDEDEDATEEFDFDNYPSMAPYASPLPSGGVRGAMQPGQQVAYYVPDQAQQLQLRTLQHWPLPPTPQSAASSSTATTGGASQQRPLTAPHLPPPQPPSPQRAAGPKLALDVVGAAPPLQPPPPFAHKAASGTFYSPASSPAASARSSAQLAPAPGSPRKGPQLDLAATLHQHLSSPSVAQPPPQQQQQNPESPRLQHPAHPTHSRQGSDSVAYVREELGGGGAGEYRWVLERRRAGEDGSSELVRRDFVEGGMI